MRGMRTVAISRRSRNLAMIGVVVGLIAVGGLGYFANLDDKTGQTTGSDSLGSLTEAVASGDLEAARSLLLNGVDPDEPRVLGLTPIMRAAVRDDAPMVRLLLDSDADLNATAPEGLKVWHVAAQSDSAAVLGILIDAEVDLAARSSNGMNTLEHAAATGSVEAIVLIAATGVDLDAPSEIVTQGHGYPIDVGTTALGIAARAGQFDAVSALLDLGALVDAPSSGGQSPLLASVLADEHPEIVSILLDAGADPLIRAACTSRCSGGEGDTIYWAKRLGRTALVPLLEGAVGE